MGLEIGGIALGIIGWIISIVACALPMWRVSALRWRKHRHSTSHLGRFMDELCRTEHRTDAVQGLRLHAGSISGPSGFQSHVDRRHHLGRPGVLISIMGAKCTNCIEDEAAKAKVMIISGVMFVIAGILEIIPPAWVAHQTIRDFYNPLLSNGQQRELGSSIYIGFAAAALLLIGGAMLCCTCPPREKKYKPTRMGYSAPRSTSAGYDRKDYV